jgi:hypothetical protein
LVYALGSLAVMIVLTSFNVVFLEKLTVDKLAENISTFDETQRFVIVFTRSL